MLVPPNHSTPPPTDRLRGRPLRIGVKTVEAETFVEHHLPPGADLVIGTSGPDVVEVARWEGPDVRLVSRGRWLELGPGMRVIMCHEDGTDRMEGSFEELSAAGVTFPHYVNCSRLNVRVKDGVVVLMEYMGEAATAPT